uniref:Outer membrane protein beta-barrel domain-containing protein n=1 Tax=Candidatus Kentrum sp. LFY TaxID=2126342 RepID=A0A450V026_9GAMM|nr:MAG: Outer membrane protein beta-barrel domain-containing protein [Candidatus Kentron sp. LFY]
MLKKTTFLLISVLSISAFAEGNNLVLKKSFYLSGAIGPTFTRDSDTDVATNNGARESGEIEMDNAMNFSLSAGRWFTPRLRGDVEFSYRKADMDRLKGQGGIIVPVEDSDVKTIAALVNLKYDILTGNTRPYISAGLGLANHDVKRGKSDTVFAYQAGVGVISDIDKNISAFLGYRYLGTSDIEFSVNGEKYDAEYGAHELHAGLHYNF